MKTYTVKWELEVQANSARDAADQARRAQLDPDNVNDKFVVNEHCGGPAVMRVHRIKLSDDHTAIPDYFKVPLQDADAARYFITTLHAHGLLFHFNDDPESVVTLRNDVWVNTFTADQVALLNERVAECFALLEDPFTLCVELIQGECPET